MKKYSNYTLFFVVCISFQLNGCKCFQPMPVDSTPNIGSQHQEASQAIRRVAILPMESNLEENDFAQRLRGSIVKSLRTSGAFEVIDIQPHELGPCKTAVIRNGNYDERQLNWLMKNHSVDAVMFSRLNHARTVAPQSCTAICHIVDAREAFIIATVEGAWDLSDQGDLTRFQKFISLSSINFVHSDMAKESPQVMAEFVGKEIAMEIF